MTTVSLPRRPLSIRPLALPNEHGGWGFLFEPIVLALLVAPSWSGALVACAAVFAFLVRHPLKLALQDAVRERHYPRTTACWILASSYLLAAGLCLAAAVARSGIQILIPLGLVAPLALTQVLYDAWNRGRDLLPEMSGAAAMSSIAAAIAIAGRMPVVAAFALSGIILARSLPSILYVRRLLGRMPAWPAIALHVLAIGFVAAYASPFAAGAMVLLLIRAVWGVTHAAPRAQTIGWREIVFGALTVLLAAVGYYWR